MSKDLSVEMLEIKPDMVRFILGGVKSSFANAIRRICTSELPKLAIDEVNIYDNTSAYYDE
ncbi:MAG: hypothetical protein ACXQS2_04370 [Methermicoccaceae archaeon]